MLSIKISVFEWVYFRE